jgi:hypothetical protein
MSRLVLRIERGGEVLGSWPLDGRPLTMAIVEPGTGRVLGRFSASGAEPDEPDTAPSPTDPGSHDEIPLVTAPARSDGDDLTMPLPEPTEQTEPTADLMPDTAETEEQVLMARVKRSRPRPIPNLASRPGGEPDLPTQEVPAPLLDDDGDDEGTADLLTDADMLEEDTGIQRAPSGQLAEEDEIDLEGLEDEPDTSGPEDRDRPTTFGEVVPPAEVWVRRQSEWRSGGSLRPGQRAVARGGWVRLRRDGRLVVRPGPTLAGSATLLDGQSVEIARDVAPVELPAGASVLLRAGEYGIYVRSEPYALGGRPTLGG